MIPEQWLRHSLRWFEYGLWIVGLVLLSHCVRSYDEARAFAALEATRFEEAKGIVTLGSKPASELAMTSDRLESGVFGRISIPRLGLSALIAEGTNPQQLEKAVGHFTATALPGEDGNCALAGHRDSFLRGLGRVRKKDLIRIDTLRDSYTYEVQWGSVVEPDRVDVLDHTSEPSLTLVTCYPFHVVGPAPDRYVVRAKLVESTN